MSRTEYKASKREFVSSVEPLEDRQVLNVGVPTPPTPAPAPGPFSVAMVRRFDQQLQRLDREFLSKSEQLNMFVMQRTAQIESLLARTASHAQVMAQQALNTSSTLPHVSLATQDQALNMQLGRSVASFNTRLTQLNNSLARQFGGIADSFKQADSRFAIPASAFRKQFRSGPRSLLDRSNKCR